jgi:serine/threonine protein kinase
VDSFRDPSPYACGDTIAGKYKLLRGIGAGGMGVVWVAHNLVLDVHVALKLIRSFAAGPDAGSRLLREARSAARIAHPGVVRIFDFGKTDRGDPFIVMEMLEGETLRDLLEREGRIEPRRAVSLLLPVAEALATLADSGIVHRDLKPENIILAQGNEGRIQPKLVDFGVAIRPGSERFTGAGLVVGSPDYLAPEQAAGEEVDHRIDVWAFSVVLFETLTGERPFTGDTIARLVDNIFEEPAPSITSFRVNDEELAAIVQRGLEKSRDARWSSMRQLGAALAGWAVEHGVTEDVTGAAIRTRASEPERSRIRASQPELYQRPSGDAKTDVSPGRRRQHDSPSPSRPGPPPASRPTRLLPALELQRQSDEPSGDVASIPAPPKSPWTRPRIAVALLIAGLLMVFAMSLRGRAPATNPPTTTASGTPITPAPNTAPSDTASSSSVSSSDPAPRSTARSIVTATASAIRTSARPPVPPTASPSASTAPSVPSPSLRIDDLKDPYKKTK